MRVTTGLDLVKVYISFPAALGHRGPATRWKPGAEAKVTPSNCMYRTFYKKMEPAIPRSSYLRHQAFPLTGASETNRK